MADIPSDIPPPESKPQSPAAGWYNNPSGDGLRWWDGSNWSDATQPMGAATVADSGFGDGGNGQIFQGQALMPIGEWLSRTFRFAMSRAGHFLPMLVMLILPGYLLLSVCLWYSMQGVVMLFDREVGTVSFEQGVSRFGWLYGAIITWLVLALLFQLLYAAVCHQTASGNQMSWLDSLRAGLRRWPQTSVVMLARWAAYLGLALIWAVLTAFNPAFVLVAPLLAIAATVVWVRLSLGGVAASLQVGRRNSLAESWAATSKGFMGLWTRLAVLSILGGSAAIVGNLIGGVFAAIAGGQPTETVEPFAERIPFDDLLPSNPAAYAISWLFLGLGAGAWQVLSAVGHTYLYDELADNEESLIADPVVAPE